VQLHNYPLESKRMQFLLGFLFATALAETQGVEDLTREDVWTETGTVPDKLSRVPDSPVYMNFGETIVFPNMTMDTGDMIKKPNIGWNADPSALYTLLIEDVDIESQPFWYAHWLVTNIPGDDVYNGEAVATYLPSWYFHVDEEGQLLTDPQMNHRHLVLVYKQKGRIDMAGQAGCTPGLVEPPRTIKHDELQAEYDLEGPVAGTFYRTNYSQGWTEYYLCYFRKCLGFPFPSVIPGVNDGPECIGDE